MNPKLQKMITDIERTKEKIAELQALLPELERKKIDFENTEIIKLVRAMDVAPDELTAFIKACKKEGAPASAAGVPPKSAPTQKEEKSDNEE